MYMYIVPNRKNLDTDSFCLYDVLHIKNNRKGNIFLRIS